MMRVRYSERDRRWAIVNDDGEQLLMDARCCFITRATAEAILTIPRITARLFAKSKEALRVTNLPPPRRFGQRSSICTVCSGAIRFYPQPQPGNPAGSPEVGSWAHMDESDWLDNPHQPTPPPVEII
jgi:hypothetical protein